MNATTWLIIAIVGFSLAGVAFIAAVFMFIKMKIPAIIGDLTGKTVAREIKAMRDANATSGDKRFRSSKVNLERGMLTDKVANVETNANVMKRAHASKRLDKATDELSGSLINRKSEVFGFGNKGRSGKISSTEKTESFSSTATEVLNENLTEILVENATEVLASDATEVLSEGTTVLSEGTTVLAQTEELEKVTEMKVAFKVVKSEMVVHSDEVI